MIGLESEYNQLVDMNIFTNHTEQYIQNKEGHLNVSGNQNVIHVRNCSLTISVNGNQNTFDIQYCTIQLQVNGNANRFRNTRNNISFGFNGNNNQVLFDPNSNYNCLYANGSNNRFPNPRERQRQQHQYQPDRQRNRSHERQPRQRINRAPNQVPNNQGRRQQRHQQHVQEEHPYYHQMSQGFGRGIPFQFDFMEHIQAGLNAMFQNQMRRQNLQFQFRPSRNVFVFQQGEEEEEQRGLRKEHYDLLPKSLHKGREVNCTICLDDISEGHQETFLICFHAFHTTCIKDWLIKNAKCPVCQYDLKQYFNK